jgi:hypothetical protein
MQILIDHISYVLATLLAGVLIGWSTYPAYARLRQRLSGDEPATAPVRVRTEDRRRR